MTTRARRRAIKARRPHDPLHNPLLRHLPIEVIEYPLELVLSLSATFSGLALLLGVSDPVSVAETMPEVAQIAWGLMLTLSGATIGFGLVLHHYGTSVARGLGLLGTGLLVYAISIFYWGGWQRSIPAGPLVGAIALLCYARSWWLAAREQLLRYLGREGNDGMPLQSPPGEK